MGFITPPSTAGAAGLAQGEVEMLLGLHVNKEGGPSGPSLRECAQHPHSDIQEALRSSVQTGAGLTCVFQGLLQLSSGNHAVVRLGGTEACLT